MQPNVRTRRLVAQVAATAVLALAPAAAVAAPALADDNTTAGVELQDVRGGHGHGFGGHGHGFGGHGHGFGGHGNNWQGGWNGGHHGHHGHPGYRDPGFGGWGQGYGQGFGLPFPGFYFLPHTGSF